MSRHPPGEHLRSQSVKDCCCQFRVTVLRSQFVISKAALAVSFNRIVCAEEVGLAKEVPEFWLRLEKMLGFHKERTLLGDDTEKVLLSALVILLNMNVL